MDVISEKLFPNEQKALIEALRRDAQCERDKAFLNPALAEYHLQNARMSVRILEAFGQREERYRHISFRIRN
jgi:hypothetical protein